MIVFDNVSRQLSVPICADDGQWKYLDVNYMYTYDGIRVYYMYAVLSIRYLPVF